MSRGLVVVTLSSHVDSMVLFEECDEYIPTRYFNDVIRYKMSLSLSRDSFTKDLKGIRLRSVQTGSTGRDGSGRWRRTGPAGQDERIYSPRRTVFHPAGAIETKKAKARGQGWTKSRRSHWVIGALGLTALVPYPPNPSLRLHLLLRVCPPIRLLDRLDPAWGGIEELCLVGYQPSSTRASAVPPLPSDHRSWSTRPLPNILFAFGPERNRMKWKFFRKVIV